MLVSGRVLLLKIVPSCLVAPNSTQNSTRRSWIPDKPSSLPSEPNSYLLQEVYLVENHADEKRQSGDHISTVIIFVNPPTHWCLDQFGMDSCNNYWIFKFISTIFHLFPPFPLSLLGCHFPFQKLELTNFSPKNGWSYDPTSNRCKKNEQTYNHTLPGSVEKLRNKDWSFTHPVTFGTDLDRCKNLSGKPVGNSNWVNHNQSSWTTDMFWQTVLP